MTQCNFSSSFSPSFFLLKVSNSRSSRALHFEAGKIAIMKVAFSGFQKKISFLKTHVVQDPDESALGIRLVFLMTSRLKIFRIRQSYLQHLDLENFEENWRQKTLNSPHLHKRIPRRKWYFPKLSIMVRFLHAKQSYWSKMLSSYNSHGIGVFCSQWIDMDLEETAGKYEQGNVHLNTALIVFG